MADESIWIERAQTAEMKVATMRQAHEKAADQIKTFKATMGVREASDGSLVINYDKFAKALGMDGALELRRIIDETYGITGAAGQKPRIKVTAAA